MREKQGGWFANNIIILQLLNFSALRDWHQGFIRSLAVHDSSKTPESLVPGDKVDADIEGQKFTAEIKVSKGQLYLSAFGHGLDHYEGMLIFLSYVGKFRESVRLAGSARVYCFWTS